MHEHLYTESEFAQLKEALITVYEPYYLINDEAHQIDHVVAVCDRAIEINEHQNLGLDRRMIVIAALTHDLFTRFRSNHHIMAYHFLETAREPWLVGFTNDEKQLMAFACLEHRASWKGDYTSLLSELIATADRGVPGNLDELVWRCYLYGRDRLKENHQDAKERIIPHLVAKLCKDDYGKNPPLYATVYGKRIEDQRNLVMSLDAQHPVFENLEERFNDHIKTKNNPA